VTCTMLTGDARRVLDTLPACSVQCVVTSPPFFGLRSYLPADHPDKALEIGAERGLPEYIANLVGVFAQVRRLLRDDGTVFLNLGDSYGRGTPVSGGAKQLLGVPWRVAFALQAAGWYLRSDIILTKANPMPESVTDRCTRSHEYLFLLTKGSHYFYDAAAIAEPCVEGYRGSTVVTGKTLIHVSDHSTLRGRSDRDTRNKRDVWPYSAENYAGSHYAVMPRGVIEPCVLAGSRPGDTVLDPFSGAGSVGMVALSHGRSYIGIDLDERNMPLAEGRIGPMLLDEPHATTPPARIVDKQAGTGNRTTAGFNARWDAQEALASSSG
jgi:DNA modification methylase